MPWKPKPRTDVDLTTLPLDAQQGFLLSRLDGASDVVTLAKVTGFAAERVEAMLVELVRAGAVAEEGAASQNSRTEPARLSGETARWPEERLGGEGYAVEPVDAGAANPESPAPPPAPSESAFEPEPTALFENLEEPAPPASTADLTHRALFETRLHHLSTDERTAFAKSADDPELSAFGFDPVAAVVLSLLENPRFGLSHARIVAANHHTGIGLEALAARAAFAADEGVRRALLRNPQLPASVFRRIWGARRLSEQYLAATSREVSEGIRSLAREVLRTSFAQRTGDEKVELILQTEGRCLALLVGIPLDAKAAALLCRRTYVSNLFIQNFARWSATPPQLIAHLRRQEVVKRTPQLRMLLERHPNAT